MKSNDQAMHYSCMGIRLPAHHPLLSGKATQVMTYEEALKTGKKIGASKADDKQLMALLLEANSQILLGAVSPKLIWEGAQTMGLTTTQLANLIVRDPDKARELMWIDEEVTYDPER